MQRILLATDGSEHSKKAMAFAQEMAQKYDARLDILHVVTITTVPEDFIELLKAEEVKEPPEAVYLEKVGRKILELCGESCQMQGISESKLKTFILKGDPAQCIIEFAEEEEVDVVVLGRRGLGGLKGRLMGSVSRKVSHYVPCTCVLVK